MELWVWIAIAISAGAAAMFLYHVIGLASGRIPYYDDPARWDGIPRREPPSGPFAIASGVILVALSLTMPWALILAVRLFD